MPAALHTEIIGSYFAIEIKGVEMARFTEVSGLGWETEVKELAQSTKEGKAVHTKTPGRTKFGDITLKRGFSTDKALADWYKTIVSGVADRKTGSIIVYDREGAEKGRWNFENAWPSKWKASDLSASSSEVLIEEVTLAIEHLEWKPK